MKFIFIIGAGVLLLGTILVQLASVRTGDNWEATVTFEALPEVSGLILQGSVLYATLETRKQDGKILALREDSAHREVLVDGLQKADGLAIFDGQLVYTQESGRFPVFQIVDGQSIPLFEAVTAEGIDIAGNGDIYVVEDRPAGRLLKYDRQLGKVEVLVSGLEAAEGLCVMADQDIYFTEKDQGVLYRLSGEQLVTVLDDLRNPGYLNCDEDRQGLWITEDRRNFGRLLFLPLGSTTPRVVASSLRSPQSIAFEPSGSILMAEAGRQRILRLVYKGQGAD